ncbi:MAG TPA: hypothetical protein VHW73_11710 [Rudaea sp.]|jgi:hypothetical protein|nr:hypothetical protein [Rudaea sp.]
MKASLRPLSFENAWSLRTGRQAMRRCAWVCVALAIPVAAFGAAPPTVAKNFNPASIVYGDHSTLTVTFTNSQTNPAQLSADFIDTFPANLVVANPANAQSNCDNAVGSATPGSNTVTMTDKGNGNPAAIPAQGQCVLTVQVTAAVLPPPNSYTNTIKAGDLKTNLGNNPADATATLNVTTSPPTVAKSFNPASVVLGESSVLTITLTNNDHIASTLTDDLVDMFPAGLEVAETPDAQSNCPGGLAIATAGDDSVTLSTGAQIPAQGQCVLTVSVTSQGPGVYTNTIDAGDLQTSTGNNPADASDTLAVTSVPPTVAKSFNPTTINLGTVGSSTLTITLANQDHKDATLTADLVDTLPAHLLIAAPADAQTNCVGGVVNATPGANTVTLATGTKIPQQGQCVVTVQVTADAPGNYTNKIGVGSLVTDLGVNSNSASASVTASASPPTLAKAFSPSSITAGTTSQLTITLNNPNTATAVLSAALNDALPAGVVVANPASAASTCFGGTLTANSGSNAVSLGATAQVPAKGSCAVSASITASATGTYTNTLGVGALQTSLGASTSAVSASLTVTAGNGNPTPPTIGAAFVPANIAPDETSRLTIAFYNPNATAATTTALFTASLPSGLTIASPPNLATTCGSGLVSEPNNTSFTLGSGAKIPARSSCTITAAVTGATTGTYTFTIPVHSLSTDDGSNASAASARLQVQIPPDLIFRDGFE